MRAGSRRRKLLSSTGGGYSAVRRIRPLVRQYRSRAASATLPPASRQAPAAEAFRHPGLHVFPDRAAAHPHRRPHVQEQLTISRCRVRIPRNSTRKRPSSSTQIARMPDLQDVNTDLEIKQPAHQSRDRPRPRGRPHLNWQQHLRTPCTAPSVRSYASTIYSPNNQYRVLLEMQPKYQAALRLSGHDLFQDQHRRHWFRSIRVAKIKEDAGPQSISHAGQLALRHGLVQSQARASPWGRRPTSSKQLAKHTLPATITGTLPGNRQGLPGFACQPEHPADRGDRWWSTSCSACCMKATSIR